MTEFKLSVKTPNPCCDNPDGGIERENDDSFEQIVEGDVIDRLLTGETNLILIVA